MSFISLPDHFSEASKLQTRAFQIASLSDGAMVPVGMLRGEASLPVSLEKLSENLASLMNGRNPLHHLDGAQEMYYERFPGGMNFRFREPGKPGISRVGATLTAMPGFEHTVATCLDQSAETTKLFMAAAQRPERRAKTRTAEKTGVKPPAPAGKKPVI